MSKHEKKTWPDHTKLNLVVRFGDHEAARLSRNLLEGSFWCQLAPNWMICRKSTVHLGFPFETSGWEPREAQKCWRRWWRGWMDDDEDDDEELSWPTLWSHPRCLYLNPNVFQECEAKFARLMAKHPEGFRAPEVLAKGLDLAVVYLPLGFKVGQIWLASFFCSQKML